jgi:hypothetical protein
MPRVLSDEEVEKIEACFIGADFMVDLTHSLREARRERDAARAALREQWEVNHHEYCRATLPPHPGICHWPMPRTLGEEA